MASKTASKQTEIEFVEWIDAVASTGWMERSAGFPVQTCFSVGQVIEEGKDHIVLAGTWGHPEDSIQQVNCVMSIPKAWVKQRKKLKV